ncbi:glycosyltransferase 87 family protein [Actinosynnema sp. NPDC023587]|uniref:glycosyltransferase 87 family protein n=1 Tax=Actinosynnema sp. NPDC023587 TaxID=3154695 RepID=UPI003410B942
MSVLKSRRWWLGVLLSWLSLMAAATVILLIRSASGGLLDLQVYRVGGQAWLGDYRLYVDSFAKPLNGPELPFTYPPLAAVLFSVLAVVPWPAAVLVWTIPGLLLLTAVCVVGARHVYGNGQRAVVIGLALAAGGLLLEPVRNSLDLGQINLLLMGLVALDCLLPKTRWPRGLLIGFAAAIKLTPLVFVLFFLPRKQVKPVVTAIVAFLGFGLIGFAAAPTDSKQYWFESLLDPGRVGGLAFVGNQSLRGLVHRLWFPGAVETAIWAVLGLATVVLVWVAVRRAQDDRLAALIAVAVGGLLISPVTWSHHWVWVVPGLLLLGRQRVWAGLVVALFLVAPMWFLPSEPDPAHPWSWWQHVIGNAYVWAGLAALVVLARRRSGARPAPLDEPGVEAAVGSERLAS